MNSKEAIKAVLKSTQDMLNWYVSDLGDADFLVRPVPNANHIAWHIGHLTAFENGLLASVLPHAVAVEAPAGFKEKHSSKAASSDNPKDFLSRMEYVTLFNKVREGTTAAVDKMSDSDCEKASPADMVQWAPTLNDLLLQTAIHTMMHVGQFTVIRRKLGKPILF
ncbi:MAG TPA: DinB family protein [Gemmataceae bacterium]|nr:DinB family protein [Gemmataceae bacterium]